MSVSDLLNDLETSEQGVSEDEVKRRLLSHGPNELRGGKVHWYQVLLRQFYSPFLYLLVLAAIVSFFLHELVDGYMILLFVSINTILGFYQEYRSERTLELLKGFVRAKATVIRGGQELVVESKTLVPGDIIIVKPGDILPADVRFLEVESLRIDESTLSGESVNVVKRSDPLKKAASSMYESSNIGFSGTSVVGGEGKGVVIATSKDTVLGQITTLSTTTKHVSSFEKGINRLSVFILKVILLTLIGVVLANLILKGGQTNVFTLIIFAIALAISVIPEALPVVTTFSLSRGALHLARHRVIVKRLSAVEGLGSIEVLCTDKTGTITENKLKYMDSYPRRSDELLYTSAFSTPLIDGDGAPRDPFDNAILHELPESKKHALKSFQKIEDIPFTPQRRRNSVLVMKDEKYILVTRGAVESLLPLCRLSKEEKEKALLWAKEQGQMGRRVVAIAEKKLHHKPIDPEKEERELIFLGLLSFEDPLKDTAPDAIAKAKRLGVNIKILTGDSPDVAGAVASAIHLISDPTEVIVGDVFDKLHDGEKRKALEEYAVFARVSPIQKHEIIELLKERYEVGFLGEGINDAPALKAANVAIVVEGASDIAREASDIVLLHKSLKVVIDGVHEGREIFGNTVKYIKATLASNFGNFYTIAIASLLVPFLPLLPLQILLINLLTDFPMIAVVTDTIDTEELKRPKNYDVKEIALFSVIMGAVSTIFDFLFFALFYHNEQLLQTNWFIGSVLTELLFLFAIRTKLPVWKAKFASLPLTVLSGIALLVAIVLPFTSFGHSVFFFISPSMNSMVIIILITVLFFVATEVVKQLYYKYVQPKNGMHPFLNVPVTTLSDSPKTQ